MRTPKINTKKLAAALAPIALAGAVMAPAAAASPPPRGHGPAAMQSKVGYTRGFDIYNYTSHPLTLYGVLGTPASSPSIGTVVKPGSSQHFELTWWFGKDEHVFALYDGPTQTAEVKMMVGWGGGTMVDGCNVTPGACGVNGTVPVAYLFDPPGTVNNYGPDQKQAQADALQQLCDTGVGQCTFNPTSETHVYGPAQPSSHIFDNPDSVPANDVGFDNADTVGMSDSLGVEFSAGVEKVVSAAVHYEHEWYHDHEYKESEHANVPDKSTVWFCHVPYMIRDTGDFTAKLGNTTWNITGVSFDTPDVANAPHMDRYYPTMEPIPNPKPAGTYCDYQPNNGILWTKLS
jgi:hypothetical protein